MCVLLCHCLISEFLLAMPDLLPRLIKIVTQISCKSNCHIFLFLFHFLNQFYSLYFLYLSDSPRYRGMDSELDCWMEWIENSMADAAFDQPSTDDLENFIGG